MGIKRDMSDIIAEVRDLADMENTDFVTDTEITAYVNDARREAWQILAESYEDWYITAYDFATVAGTRDYSLPSDFIRLRKVFWVRDKSTSSEREYPLRRVTWDATDSRDWAGDKPDRFMLRGSNIRLFPLVEAVYNYRIYYSAAPAALTSASTSVEWEYGLDRFCVWDAVVRCLIKEKSDVTDARAERDRHWALALKSADNRDASEPRRTQEVMYRDDSEWWERGW